VPIAMNCDIGISGTWIEALPNHQDSFSKALGAAGGETHVRCQSYISGESHPGEVELVRCTPQIRSAAGKAVVAGCGNVDR